MVIPSIKNVLLFAIYAVILLYVITFPSNASWFLGYFSSLIFFFSYFSAFTFGSRFSLQSKLVKQQRGRFDLKVGFTNALPLLAPFVRLSLEQQPASSNVVVPVFFKKNLVLTFSNICLSRGAYTRLQLTVETRDFFGWFKRRFAKTVPVDLHVYPQPLPPECHQQILNQLSAEHSLKKDGLLNSMELKQLRAYRQQDTLRDIDWKTSLRRQQMVVKEYEFEDTEPLNLFFFAAPSESFEQLLSLTYDLYLDFSQQRKVRLFLIGQYGRTLQIGSTQQAFLTVKPVSNLEKLFQAWQQLPAQNGIDLLILPQQTKGLFFKQPAASLSFLTEQALESSGGETEIGR